MRQLENESEQLDLSFQKYLRKQDEEKRKLNNSVNKIWENYNFKKQILNQTPNISGAPSTFNRNYVEQNLQFKNMNTHFDRRNVHSDNMIPIDDVAVNVESQCSLIDNNFENPYKMITVEDILLTKSNPFDLNEKVPNQKRPEKNPLQLKSRSEVAPAPVTKNLKEIFGNNENVGTEVRQPSATPKLIKKSSKIEKTVASTSQDQNSEVLQNPIIEIQITKPSEQLSKNASQNSIIQTSIRENLSTEKINIPGNDNENVQTLGLSSQSKEQTENENMKPIIQTNEASENDASEQIINQNETSIGEKSTSSDDFW